jgi:hypothetical protein
MIKPGPSPSETVIGGAWTVVDGKVQGDAATARIQELVAWHLQVVAADSAGWETLYRDPDDGRLWELTFPHSELQGGGPPQLRVIEGAEAETKYGGPIDYFEEARTRARRRKSPWNLLLIPASAMSIGLITWRAALLLGALHQAIYPGQTFTSTSRGLGAILAALAPFFGAIPLGLYLGNVLVWLVPPARRALDREALPYPGTGFREAQGQLLLFARYLVLPALVAGLVGALLPWYP